MIKLIKNITSYKLFFGLISLVFIYLNYSFSSWIFFNNLGGLVLAKIGPEISGIIFFALLSLFYIKTFYKDFKIKITRQDWNAILFLFATTIIFRYKQFYTYFWKDDFYFFLNRFGTGYSFYKWGPWLSSFPAWTWETVRFFFGYSVFPYQFTLVFLHFIFAVGVFFMAKYLSNNRYVGIISAFLVITTTITFEAFEYYMNPINVAWQGFLVCIAVIACVWEIRKNKGESISYLFAFLILPTFMSGIARVGFVLPFISTVIFFTSLEFLNKKNVFVWIKNLILNQIPVYLPVFVFFTIRGLWNIGSTKTEVVTAPIYRIYLYMLGIISVPVEFYTGLNRVTSSVILPGVWTVYFGLVFIVAFVLLFLVARFKNKKIPLILSVGLSWLTLSTLFYTLFAPHLPTTDLEIDTATRTHHLAYIASTGALIIYAFIFYKIGLFFFKLKKPFGQIIVFTLLLGSALLSYNLLNGQYIKFLDFAKGATVPRQEFFFETYRKYIPRGADKVNIFYDDGASTRRDNYKPDEYYYWAFWDQNKVRIFWGDKELRAYLAGISDTKLRNNNIDNLYYIYTDYDDGRVEENLSGLLRDSIYNPKIQNISPDNWKAYWGKKSGKLFLPEILYDKDSNINYFNNPTIFAGQISFPSVLTPKLNMTLNIQRFGLDTNYVDLRAGILSQLLNNWTLPSKNQIFSLAKYYLDNPSQSNLAFNDLLNSVHVSDKMVCGQKTGDNGIAFLVAWFGEPDSYHSRNGNKELLSGYLDRYYSICYFPDLTGYKNINIELPNIGSVLRQVVMIPLTKQPISIQVLNAELSTPNFK